jgi:hypothetical protein
MTEDELKKEDNDIKACIESLTGRKFEERSFDFAEDGIKWGVEKYGDDIEIRHSYIKVGMFNIFKDEILKS